MNISTAKSKAMVLDRKRVGCPLQVGGEVLPYVEECEIDRRIGAASAVMQSVYRTVTVESLVARQSSLFTCQFPLLLSPIVINFG